RKQGSTRCQTYKQDKYAYHPYPERCDSESPVGSYVMVVPPENLVHTAVGSYIIMPILGTGYSTEPENFFTSEPELIIQ
ncbi:5237_t:CDS:1, partial [Ambispora gerdemannii]